MFCAPPCLLRSLHCMFCALESTLQGEFSKKVPSRKEVLSGVQWEIRSLYFPELL